MDELRDRLALGLPLNQRQKELFASVMERIEHWG